MMTVRLDGKTPKSPTTVTITLAESYKPHYYSFQVNIILNVVYVVTDMHDNIYNDSFEVRFFSQKEIPDLKSNESLKMP